MSAITIKLIIVAIFLGLSGISWVIRQLQEKARERAAAERRRQREDEFLRTGRQTTDDAPLTAQANLSGPANSADAQARLRELAARRQAQLRELRQRPQSGPTAAPAAPQTAEPVRAELWPGGPVIEVAPKSPARPSAPPPRPTPRPQPVARPQAPRPQTATPSLGPAKDQGADKFAQQQRRKAGDAAVAKVESQRQQVINNRAAAVTRAETGRRRATAGMGAGDAAETVTQDVVPLFTLPKTADQWRMAFILCEVLGPPLANRAPNEMPGHG